MSVETLLDLIAKLESGGNYNRIYSGIKAEDYPAKAITCMTIDEVLKWQWSIDKKYPSEACGAFQMLKTTLSEFYAAAWLTLNDLYNSTNQRKLAVALLKRRGLEAFLKGSLSAETFAMNLAKEWASLPCVEGPKKGKSFYAGDGLNTSLTSVEDFMAVILSCR